MVTLGQIQNGVAAYIDSELLPQFSGLNKILIGTAMGLAIKKFDVYADMVRSNPIVKTLDLVDDDGNFDIESIAKELKKNVPEEGFTIDIPMMGAMRFKKPDIDKLYSFIIR